VRLLYGQSGTVRFSERPDCSLGWPQLLWIFTTVLLEYYIPLTWMSFGLHYRLDGMHPRECHMAYLLLHTAKAEVFYFVAHRGKA
jgi:hypothetical protein